MRFDLLDTLVFIAYILGTILFAMWMGSRHKSASGFFRADKQLPWYVVGASIISAGVSSEQFIGTVGIAYLYGMSVANYQWGAVIVYTILIFVFLPFYMRDNVTTMPEFLERRFNRACRNIYAVVSIVGMVIAMLGGVMFAGAKALNVLFPSISVQMGIVILAAIAATYTIYGGLFSSVWADLLQYVVLMAGGLIIAAYGLHYAGGIDNLLQSFPEKAIMLYSAEHEMIPWSGMLAAFFSVGVWYNCANQVIVQRFLGARSEWDARMGVIMAGFTMALFPLVIVIPGIIAFYLFHDQLSDGDQAWPYLVRSMLPSGFVGVVLAGLASSITGTLSAIVTSASTIFTLDIYKPLLRPAASERELHRVGRVSMAGALLVGIGIAFYMASLAALTIFELIQTVFFYMAGPITAIFFVGILWKRATPAAATTTLFIGFASIPLVRFVIFPKTFLAPYDSFPHHTFMVFVLSMLCVVVLSLFTKPKPAEELKGVIWDASALRLQPQERALNGGLRDFRLWWAVMILVIVAMYAFVNARAGGTKWYEAEKLEYRATGEATASILQRRDVKDFNLWTGPGAKQVLLTPGAGPGALQFQIPVEKAGEYRLAAVVTRGPGYGRFTVSVNGTTATIETLTTRPGRDGEQYMVERRKTQVYDAETSGIEGEFGARPGRHVVDRIDLGTFALRQGINELTFRSDDTAPDGQKQIGVDQIIVAPPRSSR